MTGDELALRHPNHGIFSIAEFEHKNCFIKPLRRNE
jgi:hypothetical protein